MATCAHCERKKGKRACPALDGVICTSCCGRHRGVDIRCPLDCPWFEPDQDYSRSRFHGDAWQQWGRRYGELSEDPELFNAVGLVEFELCRLHQESGRFDRDELLAALDYARLQLSPLSAPSMVVEPELGKQLAASLRELTEARRQVDDGLLPRAIDSTAEFVRSQVNGDDAFRQFVRFLLNLHHDGLQQFARARQSERGERPDSPIIQS